MGEEFVHDYDIWKIQSKCTPAYETQKISEFRTVFDKSHVSSIDKFIANNPTLAPIGKYIIAFEIFRHEKLSFFTEAEKFELERQANAHNGQFGLQRPAIFSQGDDWYSDLYNRLIGKRVGKDALPDFSKSNLTFITFNYDRSLEYFFYVSLRNTFTEVSKEIIVDTIKQLKIIHVYGQIAPLKWQNPQDGIDYRPAITDNLLLNTANKIRTIHELNTELTEAQKLLKQAEQIFFLGFGYAKENMDILGLPLIVPKSCSIYGTASGLLEGEIYNKKTILAHPDELGKIPPRLPTRIIIDDMDCLKLLRNYL